MPRRLRGEAGITLIDALMVVALVATIAAMAVPTFGGISDSVVLGAAQQQVAAELQRARLKAVTANRIMRVRFNCPGNGQFRTVELVGTPTNPASPDTDAARCSEQSYPYPPADNNIVTLPNHDGPVRYLDRRVSFGAVQTLEFRPNGTVYAVNSDGTSAASPLSGTGTAITVVKGMSTRSVTVNGYGRIELVR